MDPIDQALERVLVLKCQMGDHRALEDLYRRYARPLGYYLRRLLDDEAAAEDAQQEVWLTVYRRIRGLRAPEAFAVWLYRIAHSRAVNRLAKRRRNDTSLDAEPAAADLAQAPEVEDDAFSPEDAADIHRALGALRPEHREVLVLRFMEDLSYEQIAEVTGCNLGTVRSRLHYAKLALRRELEKRRQATH